MVKTLILILMVLLISSFCFAETIVLQSGKTVEGKIIEKTDKYIKIDIQGTPLTYFLDEISNIDGKTVVSSKENIYSNSNLSYREEPAANNSAQETAKEAIVKGIEYGKAGKYDEAIAEFNKAVEFNSNDDKGYYNRGLAYGHKSSSDQAISDFSKAIELAPNYADAYYNRGFTYYLKGNYDQAISDFDKTIELDPSLIEAYKDREIAYGKKGDELEKAKRAKPERIERNDLEKMNNLLKFAVIEHYAIYFLAFLIMLLGAKIIEIKLPLPILFVASYLFLVGIDNFIEGIRYGALSHIISGSTHFVLSFGIFTLRNWVKRAFFWYSVLTTVLTLIAYAMFHLPSLFILAPSCIELFIIYFFLLDDRYFKV